MVAGKLNGMLRQLRHSNGLLPPWLRKCQGQNEALPYGTELIELIANDVHKTHPTKTRPFPIFYTRCLLANIFISLHPAIIHVENGATPNNSFNQ
ncbi:hypothetical protein T4D_660 [Trichinella pseudospiralis]|uniref:Uncharacterized protein n=1 Tax=Trichinella pseudospiralis TaxID=6337 RepID=A0A0V1FW23_TRIPS|nr:hypothetical protein T4D_660 [Trichinella pseudospiralis]